MNILEEVHSINNCSHNFEVVLSVKLILSDKFIGYITKDLILEQNCNFAIIIHIKRVSSYFFE